MMIRQATKEDFPAIAEVMNSCWVDQRTTAKALEYEESKIPQHFKHGTFVAEEDGNVIAYADYTQFASTYHPQRFWAWVFVMPSKRNKSIGTQLFKTILNALQPYDPISVRTTTREDQNAALHLINKWNFSESKRYWESRLDVQTFDFSPYLNVEEKSMSYSVEITTLAVLSKRDSHYKEKYYDMWYEARLDVPRAEPIAQISYEQWHSWIIESPYMIPEATFIALDKDSKTYVGISQLLKAEDGAHLETGLTGIRRAYRRKGIAIALKLKGIAYAKEHGVPEIRTSNESNNQAMLSINETLGYVKQPVWIEFVKTGDFNLLFKEQS
jgi:mycothiol synthase